MHIIEYSLNPTAFHENYVFGHNIWIKYSFSLFLNYLKIIQSSSIFQSYVDSETLSNNDCLSKIFHTKQIVRHCALKLSWQAEKFSGTFLLNKTVKSFPKIGRVGGFVYWKVKSLTWISFLFMQWNCDFKWINKFSNDTQSFQKKIKTHTKIFSYAIVIWQTMTEIHLWSTICCLLFLRSRRICNMKAALKLFNNWVYKLAAAPRLLANHSQDHIHLLAASSEDGLLIGQFLVCPALSQPIRRYQVGALVRQKRCFHIICPPSSMGLDSSGINSFLLARAFNHLL